VAKYTLDIDVNYKSVEDLNSELKALEAEFSTLSIGSKGFTELGNKIKDIKSQLKDVELQFEGLDKEQRATALVDTFNGLTGAVGAVSSAFIAFGASSDAIEDAEKKLLGVIGVVSGLRDVSNGLVAANKLIGPAFEAIGTSIKTAFTSGTVAAQTFKAALAGLGIPLLIAGVVALADAFGRTDENAADAAKSIKDLADKQRLLRGEIQALGETELETATRRRDEAIEARKKGNQIETDLFNQLNRAETQAEKDKINLLIKENLVKNIQLEKDEKTAEKQIQKIKDAADKEAKTKRDNSNKEVDQDRINRLKNEENALKARNESLRKLDEERATEGLDLINTQFANNLARIKEAQAEELKQEDLTQKAKNAIKQRYANEAEANEIARQKAVDEFNKAQAQKDKDDAEKKATELAELRTRIADAEAVSEEQRRVREKEKLIQFYDELIAEATKNGIDVTALNKAKNDALAKQNDEFATTDLAKQKEYRQQITDLAVDSALSLINDLKSLNQVFDKDNEEAAKRAFNREKALASVQTVIETYLSASKAYTSQIIPGDPTSIVRAQIAAGVAVASGLARLAVINSQTFDGNNSSGTTGGGNAGGSVPTSLGTFAPAPTPQLPQTGGLGGAVGGGAQTSGGGRTGERIVRTYVLSGDVTDAQEAEAKLNQKRKF